MVVHDQRFIALPVRSQVRRNDSQQLGLERLIVCGDVFHPVHVVFDAEQADFAQRFFFGLEVVVKTALLDAQLLGDVFRAGAVKAFGGKHRRGRFYRGQSLLLILVAFGLLCHGACTLRVRAGIL